MSDATRRDATDSESAIVFIHGDFGDGQDTWGDIINRISPSYPALAVNRPGFAEAPSPNERFTFSGDARAVMGSIVALELPGVHLTGHSYGGLVAIEVARTRPDLLRSLQLIEPPLFSLMLRDPAVREMNEEGRRIGASHALAGDEAATEAFFTMIGAERAVERLRGSPAWEQLQRYAARFAQSEPAGDFPATALDQVPPDLPIALYTGGRSHPALRAIVTAIAAQRPNAQVLEVADAGHAVQRAGDPFIEPLLAFVREADAAWQRRESGAAGGGPAGE